MLDEDVVRLCLLIASELVFIGKEKRNFLTKHIMWLVDDFDAWNAFPWGEYMWKKFYNKTVNVVSRHTEHTRFAWAFKASSSSAHLENDEDVSHLDDNMEIDGQNANNGYSNSQHHLHLLIKALGTKIENPSIDAVVPPKVDDPMLRTIRPKYDFDEADVDSDYDDYMSLFNDEEQHAKSSLNDLESSQIRKKKMAMSVKSPFGQQSDTTLVLTKRKTRLKKTDDIVLPFDVEEDANLKLYWNNIALVMRNKLDLNTLSMVDLYNNLKVYESEIKCKSSSSSDSQNVAFVSSDNSNSTNKIVNTAYSVSAASSKDQASTTSYADDVMFSFFSNQSNAPRLDNKDLEQINSDDLKEMDLKWKVAMHTMRVKRFIKKIRRKLDLNVKETVSFDRTKVECYNFHRRCHFARECRAPSNQGNKNRDALTKNAPVDTSTTNALIVQDGICGYDWSFHAKKLTNFALMTYTSQGSSSSLSSDFEVHTFSKGCLKSYEALQKQYDQQREALNKSNLEIIGDLNDIHVNESKVLNNVVDSCESDMDDNQVNDRFKKGKGYHVVPPPYSRNYMPPRVDLSFVISDNSVFKSKVSETITNVPKIKTNASKTSKDSMEKHKIVRPSAPLIEEWESDSEDENVFKPKEVKKIVKPSLEKIEFVNAMDITVENENKAEKPRKFSQSHRGNKRNWNGLMTQKLGDGFEFQKKTCFV
nr:phospholipase-like protein [Tanacetum cinerariifolium]